MASNFGSAQLGELVIRDVGQNITNIHNQLDDVMRLIERDIAEHEGRIKALEEAQKRYTDEKQSLTGLLIGVRNESRTIKDVHELLKSQIENERGERNKRRQFLDVMLGGVFSMASLNLALNIYRVYRSRRESVTI